MSSSPQSLKNKTFTTLAQLNDGVLNDDYVHSTFETWKIKGSSTKGGKWEFKGKIKDYNAKLDDELKIQFPYNRFWFWLGLRRSGDFKFHVDAGDVSLGTHKFNVFANVKTKICFSQFAFRFGANYFGDKCESNTRLESNCCGKSAYALTQRTLVRRGNLFYGFVGTLALDNFCPCRYDSVLGYEKDNLNLYLKYESDVCAAAKCCTSGKCGFDLSAGTVSATGIYKKDKHTFGVEVKHNSKGDSVTLGAETKVNDSTTVKGKVDQNFDLSLAYKKKLNDLLTLTVAGKLALAKGPQAVDFSKFTPIPLGFQFDIAI